MNGVEVVKEEGPEVGIPEHRSSARKVFGIGLSKTGTTSLSAALNLLGISSVHFPHDEGTFSELRRADYRLSVLAEYDSVTDTPVAPFFAQLDAAWPGSRFILTVREKESWLASAEAHWRLLKETGPRAQDAPYQEFVDFINACVYGCTRFQRERFSYVYDRHLEAVRVHFRDRPSDLLVLDICGGEGWGELCSFLDLPAPDVPFPHSNRNFAQDLLPGLRAELAGIPEGDGPIVLVDQEAVRSYLADERWLLPFPEREGVYHGLPEDGDAAVREFERTRERFEPSFLAIITPSLWFLDHYREFDAHLRSTYRVHGSSDRMTVFDLRTRCG